MINHLRGVQKRLTDFNIGSVVRTMLESVAIEIDELYQRIFIGLREAIPVATYNSFNFDRLPAVPASGTILVTITPNAADVLIVAGTVFASPNAKTNYLAVSDVTIATGDTTADVLVSAATAGSIGNLAAAVTFTATPAIDGLVSATNVGALINGQDIETDEQRKQRFVLFIKTLTRATTDALIYGAKTVIRYNDDGVEIERVRGVSIVEPYLTDPFAPVSLVNVYIHNGVASTSAELIAQTVEVLHGYVNSLGVKIPGWKAAGVKVVVAAASEITLNVTGSLTAAPGYVEADLCTAAAAAITEYIRSLDIGASYLEAEAVFRVKSIPGVVNITGLPADTTADDDEKIIPGTVAVT